MFTKEWYLKNKHPLLGKHHTDESKMKNRLSHIGKIAWNKGLTRTDARVAKYLDQDFNNPSRIEKIKQSKIGKKRITTENWRKNISLANKRIGKWQKTSNPSFIDGSSKIYVTKHHNLNRYQWLALRREVLQEKAKICNICKNEPKHPVLDHIIPFRLTNDNSKENLQILCRHCHAKKDLGWSKFV